MDWLGRACLVTILLLVGSESSLAQQARWSMSPAEARIGQPTRWRLALEHDAVDQVLSPPAEFDSVGARILVTEGPRVVRVPAGPNQALTTLAWTVLGIEPGEAKGPILELALESGLPLEWIDGPGLMVHGDLAPGEDGPRPLPAGVDLEGLVPRSPLWPQILAVCALLAAVWFGFSRWRRGHAGAQPSSAVALEPPAERLARLLTEEAEGNGRAVGYGVSGALREAVEAHTGRQAPGHAKDEWLEDQASSGALTPDQCMTLGGLLERADNLKFGPAEGRLGQRELVQRAQALLGTLGQPTARDGS